MVVTIDGPAGAGKSSIARQLAEELGFQYLDTGAMYRAVALAALQSNVAWTDADALLDVAHRVRIELDGDRTWLDGREVTAEIRVPEVTEVVRYVADHPRIRVHLVQLQRQIGARGDLVTEGRDQGTVAFPEAACKVYLTASEQVRARRRCQELSDRGVSVTFDEVLRQQRQRDQQDAERAEGAMRAAADAVRVVTDDLTPSQVVQQLVQLVRQRQESAS